MGREVTGEWIGAYSYDPPIVRPSVSFRLRLTQSWLGRFSGVVLDGEGGMPEEGRVGGWLRGNRLSFKKQMPVFRVFDGGQTLPLSEYAAAKGWTVEPDTPHPPIRYEGVLSDDLQVVEGRWRTEACAVRLVGQLAALPFPACAGIWKAERHQSLIG